MITLKISSLIIAVMTASLFAAAPLTAYAQTIPLPLLQINPVNAAAASNSDDDTVVQANNAEIKQESETECEAKVSDDDKVQVGDNVNAAANDCDTTQTATVAQANVNQDNDVQIAEATACQALGLIAGINLCDNVITIPPEEEFEVWCQTFVGTTLPNSPEVTQCFSTQEECEAISESPGRMVIEDCQPFDEIPAGAICGRVPNPEAPQAITVPCEQLS